MSSAGRGVVFCVPAAHAGNHAPQPYSIWIGDIDFEESHWKSHTEQRWFVEYFGFLSS